MIPGKSRRWYSTAQVLPGSHPLSIAQVFWPAPDPERCVRTTSSGPDALLKNERVERVRSSGFLPGFRQQAPAGTAGTAATCEKAMVEPPGPGARAGTGTPGTTLLGRAAARPVSAPAFRSRFRSVRSTEAFSRATNGRWPLATPDPAVPAGGRHRTVPSPALYSPAPRRAGQSVGCGATSTAAESDQSAQQVRERYVSGAKGDREPGNDEWREPTRLRTDQAHGARIYDYILGGKDNYAIDREAGEAALAVWPALRVHMRANREFMHRAARYLAAEKGIRQFLDIGTGIPTSPNLHEVVQPIAPESRVVYVDNDPIVLVHARALMSSSPEGVTAYIDADMREPEHILDAPELRETLDLTRPVGLTLIAMVHFILDDEKAYDVVRRVVDAMPPGSYVALTVATDDFNREVLARVGEEYAARGEPLRFRTKAQAERFFEGLELEDPGVVQMHKWHPDPSALGPSLRDEDIAMYGGIGRKR